MLAIFLDIETTGLDVSKHVPIDIAMRIMNMRTGEFLVEYQALICPSQEAWERADPDSMKINGYTFEQIKE